MSKDLEIKKKSINIAGIILWISKRGKSARKKFHFHALEQNLHRHSRKIKKKPEIGVGQ